ncbi:MAG: putative DNA binding domain-containing protein [Ignavibacteriae bacterium]|nr:putative DNA binding domain-containing protein [Ignavibacteriota bacterium]
MKPVPPTGKEWDALHHSVCAFLNSEGGIVIIGIKQVTKPEKSYQFTGYKEEYEENIKRVPTVFSEDKGKSLDLSAYFPTFQIREFMDGRVGVLFVERVPEELKYVFYQGTAYERKITGDHPVHESKIKAQNEYKEELAFARELRKITEASINDLDLDKLNDYIHLLNKEVKIETIKADLVTAKPFLLRKKFISEDNVTTLGMLVCGKHPEDFIGSRCQVDCFVDSKLNIAENKKVLKNNILPLMESAVAFVYKNIQVGVTIESRGKSIPEYPEELIRECVNNSLAHRDYSVDKYVNINIIPNRKIEFRNPGAFKKSLLIEITDHPIQVRRIIPDTKPVNPKLADVLKVFNKWEGRGIGMATLVNACLDNIIDLPYYKFHSEEDLSLVINKGRLFDERVNSLLTSFDAFLLKLMNGEELTTEQRLVIAYLYKSEIENENYHYTILLTPDNDHFEVIKKLEKCGIILKHPQSPTLHPIYVLNRELMKTTYHDELRNIFGPYYDHLKNEQKDVLRVIYQS